MDIAAVSRIALALDGLKESRSGGLLRWTLDGRLVARQLDDSSIVVRIDFEDRERLLEAHPDTFFVPPRFDAHQKVVAALPHADPEVIAAAVRAGWKLQRDAD